jgi:hypothetical protein
MTTEKYHGNGSLRERDLLVVDGRADATRPEKAVRQAMILQIGWCHSLSCIIDRPATRMTG